MVKVQKCQKAVVRLSRRLPIEKSRSAYYSAHRTVAVSEIRLCTAVVWFTPFEFSQFGPCSHVHRCGLSSSTGYTYDVGWFLHFPLYGWLIKMWIISLLKCMGMLLVAMTLAIWPLTESEEVAKRNEYSWLSRLAICFQGATFLLS